MGQTTINEEKTIRRFFFWPAKSISERRLPRENDSWWDARTLMPHRWWTKTTGWLVRRQILHFQRFFFTLLLLPKHPKLDCRVYMFCNKAPVNNNFSNFDFNRNSWSTLAWRHSLRTLRRMNPAITGSTRYHPRLTPNLETSVSREKSKADGYGRTDRRTNGRTGGQSLL